ncbi:hypothetical protein NDU88_008280 [Pleurodeles waltl]|uniref:Ig-like domain-containing protein n=1 Tax=Pleurodeles waltl TaxID=8319 RepID=A0AAV7SV86_PLEWA|nr:hypothetical protein NDU88_008280 [Pleurodeles waltl]
MDLLFLIKRTRTKLRHSAQNKRRLSGTRNPRGRRVSSSGSAAAETAPAADADVTSGRSLLLSCSADGSPGLLPEAINWHTSVGCPVPTPTLAGEFISEKNLIQDKFLECINCFGITAMIQ